MYCTYAVEDILAADGGVRTWSSSEGKSQLTIYVVEEQPFAVDEWQLFKDLRSEVAAFALLELRIQGAMGRDLDDQLFAAGKGVNTDPAHRPYTDGHKAGYDKGYAKGQAEGTYGKGYAEGLRVGQRQYEEAAQEGYDRAEREFREATQATRSLLPRPSNEVDVGWDPNEDGW